MNQPPFAPTPIPFWNFVRMCGADARHLLALLKDVVEHGAIVMHDPERVDPEALADVRHNIGLVCDLLEVDEDLQFSADYTRAERDELIPLLAALATLVEVVPSAPQHVN